jgi:pectate lyase
LLILVALACGPSTVSEPPAPDDDAPVALTTTIEGFGAAVKGGDQPGHAEVLVTSLANDGPGSLREAVDGAAGPTVIRFALDGEIALEQPIYPHSQMTLDATGRAVTLVGQGLHLIGVEDVAVINLAFRDVRAPSDSISIDQGSRGVLVLHCAFSSAGLDPLDTDEHISVVWGSTDVTVAWSRFEDHDKVMLLGNGDAPAEVDGQIRVTLHDNVFQRNGRRHPFLRYGTVDLYNTLIEDWRFMEALTYGVRVRAGGTMNIERSWFGQSADTDPMSVSPEVAMALRGSEWLAIVDQDGDGDVLVADNVFEGEHLVVHAEGDGFPRPYPVTLQLPTRAWREALLEKAGNTLTE